MPIRTQVWTVGGQPSHLNECILSSEQLLENMILSSPRLMSEEWILIGRQESTGLGGRIDLLFIALASSFVLGELKCDHTKRDAMAQARDYPSWVEKLAAEDIAAICKLYRHDANLVSAFQAYCDLPLDEDSLNQSHQIVIVAAEQAASSERVVGYLSERDVATNVLCFQVFQLGEQQLIRRAWLLDPAEAPQASSASKSGVAVEPWSGELYGSFGHSSTRDWVEARPFGFVWQLVQQQPENARSWQPRVGQRARRRLRRRDEGDRPRHPGLGLLSAAQRRGAPGDGTAAGELPPRVRRRPRTLRILRVGAVAAQPAAERGSEGSRSVRQPEHHLPPDHAEMALDGGALEGAFRALNASLRFIP